MADLRTGKRFPLSLPITIHDKQKKRTATTSNLSAAGVYIWADTALEVGSAIKFDITLPGNVLGTPKDVQIECTGRVVRSEGSQRKKPRNASADQRGVACVIDHYRFIRR